jgi:hypothetical protein
MLAVLALVSLAILFALLGTAGGGGSSRSPGTPGSSGARSNSADVASGSGAPGSSGAGTDPARSSDASSSGGLGGPSKLGGGSSTFTTGIVDTVYYQPKARNAWLGRTVASGAQFILLWVNWANVSPQPPAVGSDPTDPANTAYVWSTLDTTVRAAAAHGLRVVLSVTNAPPWAEGPGRPASVAPGTWRPNVTALAAFAKAVARRYSGGFNPGTGVLPRVRYFQAWTEPNLSNNLNPQWVRVGGHWVAESPIIYRSLVNAVYRAVKAVHSSDLVITGGPGPYGDPPGGARMRPALFVRDLLCLTGRLAPAPCSNPAHFDILAMDPYSFAGPLRRAYWADDVTLPDMWKLTQALAAAERHGRVLPRIHHSVWVTEFGWNSWPPTRGAIPVRARARWIDEAFYELWRQGINTATWYLIVDQSPKLSSTATWQTGLYYHNGYRKPGFEAFRFPFVVEPAAKGSARVWGVSPDSGTVRVQALEAGRWITVLSARVRARGVIYRTIPISGHPLMRAVIGSDTSLGWRP